MSREGRILEGALDAWGAEMQAVKAVEELAELQSLLSLLAKWAIENMVTDPIPRRRDPEELREQIREELADAYIMLEQMEMVFGDVSDVEERKLLRLERDLYDAKT